MIEKLRRKEKRSRDKVDEESAREKSKRMKRVSYSITSGDSAVQALCITSGSASDDAQG